MIIIKLHPLFIYIMYMYVQKRYFPLWNVQPPGMSLVGSEAVQHELGAVFLCVRNQDLRHPTQHELIVHPPFALHAHDPVWGMRHRDFTETLEHYHRRQNISCGGNGQHKCKATPVRTGRAHADGLPAFSVDCLAWDDVEVHRSFVHVDDHGVLELVICTLQTEEVADRIYIVI